MFRRFLFGSNPGPNILKRFSRCTARIVYGPDPTLWPYHHRMMWTVAATNCGIYAFLRWERHQRETTNESLHITIKECSNVLLRKACANGNLESAKSARAVGATSINGALVAACRGEHIEVAEWTLREGATDLKWAFREACFCGKLKSLRWLYKKGSVDLQEGLEMAKLGHESSAIKWLETKIANAD